MKENPPLRPTLDLVKEIRKLPTVTESSTVIIPDNEFVVIADSAFQAKIKNIQAEINEKNDYLEFLKQKINKLRQGKIESSPKTSQLSENIKYLKSQIEKLSNEYALNKGLLVKKYNSYAKQALELQIQKSNLNGIKTFLRIMK